MSLCFNECRRVFVVGMLHICVLCGVCVLVGSRVGNVVFAVSCSGGDTELAVLLEGDGCARLRDGLDVG